MLRTHPPCCRQDFAFPLFNGTPLTNSPGKPTPRSKTMGLCALQLSFLFLFFLHLQAAMSASHIGVTYGDVADNLPSPDATVKLLRSTAISSLRLFGVNPALLRSLAHSGITVMIGVSHSDIPSLASDPTAAANWVTTNVLPFHPATPISVISVGNEVLLFGGPSLTSDLLPAMRNLHTALAAHSLDSAIKISTVLSLAIMGISDPPSSASFASTHADMVKNILDFLRDTGGPFLVNPYPYFAYQDDPRPDNLAFCLFQKNPGRFDPVTKITYTNMFDTQLDAIRTAMNRVGFESVEIVVAETGWPHNGYPDEKGASLDNAKAYNGNLVKHLMSGVGTPLMPRRTIVTYIFELYDENLKQGKGSEKAFGLYKPDLTMNYDVGLSVSHKKSPKRRWCVPKKGVTAAQLQANLDYACGQTAVDCGAIQPGGSCYLPNTVSSHSAYAMNLLYSKLGRNPWNCDFSQTATITSHDPSYGSCVYP